MRRQVFLALIVFFWPYLARADSALSLQADCPQVPDIKAWTVVNKSHIEVRVSDTVVVYLGFDIEYRNPADTYEFVRVISRHIPLVMATQVNPDSVLARDVATALYNQKEERARLNELEGKTDPVLYIQWRVKTDDMSDKQFLGGGVSAWLMMPNGDCHFAKDKQVSVEFLSENVGNGKPRNVLVGRKYEVDGHYHIIKADRNDIKNLVGGVK